MTLAVSSSNAIRTLDDDLRALIEKEICSGELPLSLKRFVDVAGGRWPTEAMILAADRLLADYSEFVAAPLSIPISVEKLCTVCNIELLGTRPAVTSGTAYSVSSPASRSGHTGKTYFESSRITIRIPPQTDYTTGRVSVAHEIGHVLVHRRGKAFDEATVRLPSSPEEEGLAEFAARLLLMPSKLWSGFPAGKNMAEDAITRSSLARVTIHSAVTRFGDPDLEDTGIRGAILWRLNPDVPGHRAVHERLTPQWHLCRGSFVPIRRSKARAGSLIADIAEHPGVLADSRVEDVRIGTFIGNFGVDAFAWGSVVDGTRLVLAVFRGVN